MPVNFFVGEGAANFSAVHVLTKTREAFGGGAAAKAGGGASGIDRTSVGSTAGGFASQIGAFGPQVSEVKEQTKLQKRIAESTEQTATNIQEMRDNPSEVVFE